MAKKPRVLRILVAVHGNVRAALQKATRADLHIVHLGRHCPVFLFPASAVPQGPEIYIYISCLRSSE